MKKKRKEKKERERKKKKRKSYPGALIRWSTSLRVRKVLRWEQGIQQAAGPSCTLPTLSHRHVLISITFPYGMVTMALVDARYEMPHETLKIRYWPRDTWPVGLPYLEVTDDEKSC